MPYDRNAEQFKNKDVISDMHIIKIVYRNAQGITLNASKSEAVQGYHLISLIQYGIKKFCQAMGQEKRYETLQIGTSQFSLFAGVIM